MFKYQYKRVSKKEQQRRVDALANKWLSASKTTEEGIRVKCEIMPQLEALLGGYKKAVDLLNAKATKNRRESNKWEVRVTLGHPNSKGGRKVIIVKKHIYIGMQPWN